MMFVCLLLQIVVSTFSEEMYATESVAAANAESKQAKPQKIMGVTNADCKKCHPSEVATWMKTVHAQSPDMRLYKFEGNTKKYATAMGITSASLLADSMCADCHATKAVRDGKVKVISGVSCESCHGAAGGNDGWLNRHQSYHASMPIPRAEETAEHREARLKHCDEAGMIRSSNLYGLSKACMKCHIIGNEKLIAAGHKSASAFDFASWSSGELKHNFLVDKTKNADAPTLWMERTGGTAENRKRVKFVVGTLTQLEAALRQRADATNPAVIPQIAGTAAAANAKLSQINAFAPTPEVQKVTTLITPILGTLFVPQPSDKTTYSQAADQVAEQAKLFAKNHNGAKLAGLDTMINQLPPHFSQQYKEKYLKN
ncbi:Perchlorate reductase subunit gamma precursor [Gimesia aquarii]|uniref:Perchlorate reductase subunit gamma n=2 Tax=Gimesia aquarii TaxID=2527964 RepID=A0A517VXV0_9PLAN|nr:Perchlorate reductase subunit gamma precursor [Gimesia aquarii]